MAHDCNAERLCADGCQEVVAIDRAQDQLPYAAAQELGHGLQRPGQQHACAAQYLHNQSNHRPGSVPPAKQQSRSCLTQRKAITFLLMQEISLTL